MRNSPAPFVGILCLVLLTATYQPAAGAACGDGVVDPGEQCDDGPFNGNPTVSCCTATCQFAAVGSMCGCVCGSMVCDGADHCATCGDVNGDGAINIGDALVVAQFDVGIRQCGSGMFVYPAACDINRDGACNIGDALRMAQCDVGLISCEFMFCTPFTCP